MAETTITHKYNIGDIVLYRFLDHLADPRVTVQKTGQIMCIGTSGSHVSIYWIQSDNYSLPDKIWENEIEELIKSNGKKEETSK